MLYKNNRILLSYVGKKKKKRVKIEGKNSLTEIILRLGSKYTRERTPRIEKLKRPIAPGRKGNELKIREILGSNAIMSFFLFLRLYPISRQYFKYTY